MDKNTYFKFLIDIPCFSSPLRRFHKSNSSSLSIESGYKLLGIKPNSVNNWPNFT